MRATQAQVHKRVEEVLQIIVLGGELHDMREYARENGCSFRFRQVQADAVRPLNSTRLANSCTYRSRMPSS